MISPAWVRLMADYNAWQNRSLYAAAATLSDDARRQDRGAFFGTIHGTLNHLLWADRVWMSRFDGWERPATGIKGSTALIEEFEALAAARIDADARIIAWAGRLDGAALEGELRWFSGASQREMARPRWIAVTHLFNHQTHHRGQVHAMLTAAGATPEATDLPWMPGLEG
ncbi:MAG: damage-inducible protein DinB [Acetobacteraceae bacterium]|nr:damage-inducible protein DinB [Acetobacteraceae bacterium]